MFSDTRHRFKSKPLEVVAQLIKFNTKKFYRPSRVHNPLNNKVSRHSRVDEVEASQYLSLKLNSIIRSKDLIQTFFRYGILLSYDRILTSIEELSATVLHLYGQSDNKVLP